MQKTLNNGQVAEAIVVLDADGDIVAGGGGGAVTVADGADVAQGTTTQAAAAADGTGNYSLIQAAKRALLNWSTLLSRIPALVSGRIPVDGSGVTQPVSGPLTDTQLRASRVNVEPLGIPGVARQLAAGAASANTALTSGIARISIHARGADIRYSVGSAAQTASATSHFIGAGERLDLDVPASAQIAVIRAGSTNGTLELSELT